MSAAVVPIHTRRDFDDIILRGVVVVKFGASWCSPCQRCAPLFEEYAKSSTNLSTNLTCASVELDFSEELAEIASQYGCSSIPMFCVFLRGKLIASKVTSSIEEVRQLVEAAAESE